MQRRHVGDAVAVVFIRRAQGYVPARDMGDGDMARGGRDGHGKDLEPVAQQHQGVLAVGGEIRVEHPDGARDGARDRLAGVRFGKNGQPRGQAGRGDGVGFDLGHRGPQPRAQVRAGGHQRRGRAVLAEFCHHRAQQAELGARGGDDGDGRVAHRMLLFLRV